MYFNFYIVVSNILILLLFQVFRQRGVGGLRAAARVLKDE